MKRVHHMPRQSAQQLRHPSSQRGPFETIVGEQGRRTAENIAQLALGAVAVGELGSNYSIGPGGSIEVRFDEQSIRILANPASRSDQ